MKANIVEKKKKKKLQAVLGEAKGGEGDGLENEKRKMSIQNGKNETFTRFLFPKNPRAYANLVEFSFANDEFTSVDQVDHTVFHLDMKSCLVQRESEDGKKQIELVKKKIEKANSFTVLKDNDYVYHKPKNCFDYIDRYAQTVPVSFKDEATKTEPQEINEICDTVCQSIIYDAYLQEFHKVSNEEDKEKDRYNENAKNEDERGKKYDSNANFGLDGGSDVGSRNLSDDAKLATVLFSSDSSSNDGSDAISEEDSGSVEKDSWKNSGGEGSGDYDVEAGQHDHGSYEQLVEQNDNLDDEDDDGDDGNNGDGHVDVSVAVKVDQMKGEDEEAGELPKEGHNKDANGGAEGNEEVNDGTHTSTVAEGEKVEEESLEKGKTDMKGVPRGRGKIGEKNNTQQVPSKHGMKKKKKKESISGKHELYFINYKDMKEKTHKELNFIYKDGKVKKSDEKILEKKVFLKTLKLMDRIYNKNNEEEIYLSYKNKINKNTLTKLWIFSIPFFNQLVVTDMKFHPFYEDLFAISFKNNDIKINTGILCCFTFKNTKNPEHILKTDFPIYSIEWSGINHSVLIIGLSNGNICIYDLKKKKNEGLIFESNIKEIYNRDIISQIYFDKKNKSFYSISYDGHMFCWKYNNKFTVGDKLLTLKKDWDEDFKDPVNFVHTQSITCIDFNPFQKNLFLIGTTTGKIYLYSSTFSDNHLRLYNEHCMSVNSVSYNPFKRGIFISASYDWTIRIWDQTRSRSLLVLDIKECVYDARWSPIVSTCFFVISSDNHGHLHIYDLSVDINKAIITELITRKKTLRKLCVNKFNEIILIGDDSGLLHSYKVSYAFNPSYVDYLRGKLGRSFQIQMMNSFLTKVQ
ncbi:conserved Plasmodium protein, unknown function [Plasmodium knowlesi strain H]|uniref:Uncharacterized protein n=3 Tax=Plasmodium knowlesi TaxID=5850 RepID=A0A5K1TU34_PLAKH|nr:dynein intermediate chain, putative [Plasmodium knowlesi strain H]OTN67318.1 Uncharacterized protein PKNOH_S06421700 [Plasmodium knowlesi]CAA9987490.1 dynein intermediate chain, putative [Plasmodium knowlesi strain H]SBO23187.1 conserved Plasmodium protein, unknown function [Plasmodium knowlesi strain H]SBO23877.1 conserved Plasmodium protein, unknown function [Plasmodium knowlesi strain H]VVS76964.1 dynein intermediate chain, putative [Plasmodium knowlesi strain H]|eukprot:XP_002258491.1 hypothetical protein, conserved in Plasmodium species [Plasmodium knowlesi strain H]